MRHIKVSQIIVFLLLLSFATALALATNWVLFGALPLGDFRGVVLTLGGVFFLYAFAIPVYRLFIKAFPLLEGEIEAGSSQEFIYHVYT